LAIKHFVSIDDLNQEEMEAVFSLAERIVDSDIENVGFVLDFILRFLSEQEEPFGGQMKGASCAGKIMGVAFYEPSTRTRLSFESAMHRLGGSVIGFADAAVSSVSKGESLADTIKVISSYCDILVIRHPVEGSARWASENSQVPVINAGDGAHEHPTQTLLDLFTLRQEKGKLEGLKVGLLGDLKYGRTVHSLSRALVRAGAQVALISPLSLRMPEAILSRLRKENAGAVSEGNSLEEFLPKLDALYVTRIQRERFSDPREYERVKGTYVVDARTMKKANRNTLVLHPLPRVGEIAPSFDSDPRAGYFRQVAYGVPVRMALVALLVAASTNDEEREQTALAEAIHPKGLECPNARCITHVERDIKPRFAKEPLTGKIVCSYCDEPAPVSGRDIKAAGAGREVAKDNSRKGGKQIARTRTSKS